MHKFGFRIGLNFTNGDGNVKKIILLLCVSLFLSGCSNKIGLNPVETVSKFDGSKTVVIQPHGADCCMAIGALWNSKAPDLVKLNVVTYAKYMNLESAELRIDSQIMTLQPVDDMTDFQQMFPSNPSIDMPTSTRGFAISVADLRRALAAKTAMIRISTLSDGQLVGTLRDGEKDSAAYYALQRFLNQLPKN